MTAVVVDASTTVKLLNLHQAVELQDGCGRTLGYFAPIVRRSTYHGVEPPVTDDELRRREMEIGRHCFTTEEVLDRLKKL